MQLDLSRVPTPQRVEQAIAEYGESLDHPTYHMFAKLIAGGKSATRAYMALFPDAAVNTAKKQASVLLAHPNTSGMIREQLAGARQMAEALTVPALLRLDELSRTADRDSKPQIDATNSILDRGGLPRAKQLAVTIGMKAMEVRAAFDDVEPIELRPLELENQLHPSDLPRQGDRKLLPGGPDELDLDRAEWASLMPVEALRTIESVSDLEAELADEQPHEEQPATTDDDADDGDNE